MGAWETRAIAAPRVFEERDVHAASSLSSSVINAALKECSAVLNPGWVGILRLKVLLVLVLFPREARSMLGAHFPHYELRDQKSERMRRRQKTETNQANQSLQRAATSGRVLAESDCENSRMFC